MVQGGGRPLALLKPLQLISSTRDQRVEQGGDHL
jgi:hypothetical protein